MSEPPLSTEVVVPAASVTPPVNCAAPPPRMRSRVAFRPALVTLSKLPSSRPPFKSSLLDPTGVEFDRAAANTQRGERQRAAADVDRATDDAQPPQTGGATNQVDV